MVKRFAIDIKEYLKKLDSLTPEEIYELSKKIINDEVLSQKIASGNKIFLRSGINYREKHGEKEFAKTKFPEGMRAHIREALPYQEGFIASKKKDVSLDSKVRGYSRIIRELKNIRSLSLNGLIELSTEIMEDPILKSVPGQKGNLKVLEKFTKVYKERLKEAGIEYAEEFLRGASRSGKIRMNSLINILTKSYLPNLVSYLAGLSKKKKS